jgi:methylenetetrahydrofolate dehydrogenase (NADP+)/methenyltetrahydrofolate cyclohydrolase
MQLPTPRGVDHRPLVEAIAPQKDVDGLTGYNLKLLLENNRFGFVPATAKGVISLLDYYSIPLEGKRVVIVGRSLLVGKPTALSFLNRNATVTICHSFTRDLGATTREAEILVIAAGVKRLIGKEHVSHGQIVVDVGINLEDGEHLAEEITTPKLVGDVDFNEVKGVVSAISPVPGGVGPMTVAMLLWNVYNLAVIQHQNTVK